jgi:hypothetical protein
MNPTPSKARRLWRQAASLCAICTTLSVPGGTRIVKQAQHRPDKPLQKLALGPDTRQHAHA